MPFQQKHKLLLVFSLSPSPSMAKTTVVRRNSIREMIFFASLVSINKLCFISSRKRKKSWLRGSSCLLLSTDERTEKRREKISESRKFHCQIFWDIQIKFMLECNDVEGMITLLRTNFSPSYQFSHFSSRPKTSPEKRRKRMKERSLKIMENVPFVVCAAFSSYALYVWSRSIEASENVRGKHSLHTPKRFYGASKHISLFHSFANVFIREAHNLSVCIIFA